jgi:hypothetical protein
MPADCPPGLSLESIHLAASQNVRTLVANSELAVCSWALEAGGSAFASVRDPLAALRCPALAQLLNSPPVSVRFGPSMERSQAGNVQRVQQALETGGVEFIRENGGGAGMPLRKATPDAG